MRTKHIAWTLALGAALLAGQPAQAAEDADSLLVGYYEGAGTEGVGIYNGSYFDMSPTTFYLLHTGSQIIYLKDELAPLAGKAITHVKFPYFNQGEYATMSRRVRAYVLETDETEFRVNPENGRKMFFDPDLFEPVAEQDKTWDFVDTYFTDGEFVVELAEPYVYSGQHNLVLQVVCDGAECSSYTAIWFYESKLRNRAMTYTHDSVDYFTQLSASLNSTYDCGTNVWLPFTKFVWTNADTGIGQVEAASARPATGVYDLQGRRVEAAAARHGIYISNGRKFVK